MGYLSRQPTSNEPSQGEDVWFHRVAGHVKCLDCGRWFQPDTNELPPYSDAIVRKCRRCGGPPEKREDPSNIGCASGENGEAD